MISKVNEKNQSLSRKNIRIPQIIQKSKEKSKQKSIKIDQSQSYDYETDGKRPLNTSSKGEVQQLKAIMSSCSVCMGKVSQFATKKPNHKIQRWTQTSAKPFLLDLIEEKVEDMYHQNNKLSKMILEREAELVQRQQQINEIQDKFTNILYTLGQDFSYLKISNQDLSSLQRNIQTNPQTPSYIKALLMDQN